MFIGIVKGTAIEVSSGGPHCLMESVAYPGILFEGGVQQIQLRTEDRENGDMGAVAPESGVLEAAVIWYKKFHFI